MNPFLVTAALVAGFSGTALAAPTMAERGMAQDARNAVHYELIAADAEKARSFVEKMAQDGIGFLGNAEMTQAKKEAEFKKLLQKSFDMATIGRFALGQYWNSAGAAQRTEYQKLFEAMIIRVYSARFSEYNGEQLNVTGARAEGKDTVVSSVIVPRGSGSRVRVDWRVRERNGAFKVVDVIIEGVSMAMTQRSDFSSVIQRGGGDVQVLIDHLKKR